MMEAELNNDRTHPIPAALSGGELPSVLPQQSCPTCDSVPEELAAAGTEPSWIYALGKIEPRFPRISVEKEFAQATSRAQTPGLTDKQALHAVLSRTENRYLARQLCWVMTIEGLETYILSLRDSTDLNMLMESVRAHPTPMDLDLVIGVKSSLAPPDLCNGLMVPVVLVDQIYSFDRDALIQSIPRPEQMPAETFTPAAEELFDQIMQMADNAGARDEHRALNYLAVRYPAVYAAAADALGRNSSLTAVDVRPSRLATARKVVDAIFSFTNRNTDVIEKCFVRVDVSEEFPFLVTKMSPYYDR
jgi:hypothetical protein